MPQIDVSRIRRIKGSTGAGQDCAQRGYLDEEGFVDVLLRHLRVNIAGHDESQKELVHKLQVGPGQLEIWLILLRIVVRVEVSRPERQCTEQVGFDLHSRKCRMREAAQARTAVWVGARPTGLSLIIADVPCTARPRRQPQSARSSW